MDRHLAEAIAGALGADVSDAQPVSGGDVAVSYRVELAGGRVIFAKTHRNPTPGFFTTEALGLQWLGAAGAIGVPEVLAVADEPAFLALSWIEAGAPAPTTEPALGRQLAALHRSGAPSFGREDRRTTGWLASLARQARWRRRSSLVSRWWPAGSRSWAGPPSRRPGCTVTCGRTIGWSGLAGATGSSTRLPTAATASSTWR
jgi:fructosamine-3-kinase